MPDGAMYMMVGLDRKAFPAFKSSIDIVEGLVREESVFCLPGECFGIKDFFRVVLTGKYSKSQSMNYDLVVMLYKEYIYFVIS